MDPDKLSLTKIRETGLPAREIADLINIPVNTTRRRILARGIKPIGYIGTVPFYAKTDVPKIEEYLPVGLRKQFRNRSPSPCPSLDAPHQDESP